MSILVDSTCLLFIMDAVIEVLKNKKEKKNDLMPHCCLP